MSEEQKKKKKLNPQTRQRDKGITVFKANPVNEEIKRRATGLEWNTKSNQAYYIFPDSKTKTYLFNGRERKVINETIPDAD